MAEKTYASGIGKRLLEITKVAQETSRSKLDKKPHFVPIDMSALEISLGHLLDAKTLDKFYQLLNKNIKQLGFNSISITALNQATISDIRSKLIIGPLVVEYNRRIVGILFNSYSSTGSNLFTPVLNKTLAEFSPSGGFDIGHLVSDSNLAKSPLQLKIEEIKSLLDIYAESKNRAKIDRYVANKLAIYYLNMYKVESKRVAVEAELHTKYGIKDIDITVDSLVQIIYQKLNRSTFQNLKATNQAAFNMIESKLDQAYNQLLDKSSYGKTLIQTDLIKTVSPVLAKLRANIVIIQDREENQKIYGARIEKAIDNFVRSDVINTILRSERFSPSLDESIVEAATDMILNKPAKSKTSKKSIKIDASLKDTKNITKGTKVQQGKLGGRPQALRTPQGRFTSVVNIETLLRQMLTKTVIKNMERPNLEYQSGRFARSVEVKSVAQRSNSLQVFLSYMKYPYQTFEPGYAQGHKGYDPRRLIDQSVREIATKLVKARLQTVFV